LKIKSVQDHVVSFSNSQIPKLGLQTWLGCWSNYSFYLELHDGGCTSSYNTTKYYWYSKKLLFITGQDICFSLSIAWVAPFLPVLSISSHISSTPGLTLPLLAPHRFQ